MTRGSLTATVTRPGSTFVTIRSGSKRITIESSVIHDCKYGVTGPPQTAVSTDVVIEDNTMQHFAGDSSGWLRLSAGREKE
ncbi:MAG: hypothetical protein QOF58_5737 [Pseudonocardiales bacterium]|jgi:hypothetical protein|nr:hypothetical protein [Pseudonocardiales bacterium]